MSTPTPWINVGSFREGTVFQGGWVGRGRGAEKSRYRDMQQKWAASQVYNINDPFFYANFDMNRSSL